MTSNSLLYIGGVLLALALISFLVSARLFRRSRTDVFWRRRREAGQRGWRMFLLGVVLLVISGMFCGSTGLLAMLPQNDIETPAQTPVVVGGTAVIPSLISTEAAAPETSEVPDSEPPSAVATVIVIITAIPQANLPTETPFVTFTPNSTPLVSSVTPRPTARITITALDNQISDTLTPVSPRTVFEAGTTRIYLFVRFRSMTPGLLWTRSLYRNGELVDGNTYLWGSETQGDTYFFFGNDSGFPPGEYEIRLFIGESDSPISSATFSIADTP